MTSSRDWPFSFSPDLRGCLGPPDAVNAAVLGSMGIFCDPSTRPTVVQFTEDGD